MPQTTDFRYWKAQTYEGGICTPLIFQWPAAIQTPGEFRREPGHVIDLMTTILEAAQAPFPKTFAGQPTTPLAGRSLLPAFAGQPIKRDGLFWEHEGNMAVQMGDWKAVNSMAGGGHWELYNLAEDRTEMHDISARDPLKLNELVSAWESWAKQANVLPAPKLPDGRGKAKIGLPAPTQNRAGKPARLAAVIRPKKIRHPAFISRSHACSRHQLAECCFHAGGRHGARRYFDGGREAGRDAASGPAGGGRHTLQPVLLLN